MDILIGNVKGPQGAQGVQGETGATGAAATIAVGSVTTTPYGNNARVSNSGTTSAAVFDFVIPQGKPGEQVTKIDNLTIDAITEPSTEFPVPAVGDNGSTLFGKISKWFSDMSALVATKLNASNVANNLVTTVSGYALDARQGKNLSDTFKTVNMFNKLTVTDTTSASGNINLPQLNADKIVVGSHTGANMAVAFFGRGTNGAYYAHITDSSGTALANTSATIDIYYV